MDRQQILDLYEWALGICFRHPARGEQPTIHLKTIRPAAGGLQDVRACQTCILEIESQHATTAAAESTPYTPGHVAEDMER